MDVISRAYASISGQYLRPVSPASISGQYLRPVSSAGIFSWYL